MRVTDIALIIAAIGALVAAVEAKNRIDIGPAVEKELPRQSQFITCPLRKPDFATVMQAAFVGDGTLIVEQQTQTKVRHIKDC
ncbi:hypothetical protein [Ancylobacter mangrovi]|uniref:Uncharacterized protein n=1 Tax=Ancylobacter mangrovi TaxID=2972472 RepID=A0A9X2PET1_9HYPH|nr:hypothetical protein [Ancylobacter mangrovi]MCS0497369.1 hypothetical protein [Ancylobacter mangrovi]MCS0504080.1 hypothetical protein [Ancylobacter mangrovi]